MTLTINHDYSSSIKLLEKDAVVNTDEGMLKNTLVSDYFNQNKQDRDKSLIIIPDNKSRFDVMQLIRDKLVSSGEVKGNELKTTVYGKAGFNRTEKGSAHFYSLGQIVEFNKSYKTLGVSKNEKLKVSAIDRESGIISLLRLKDDNVTADESKDKVQWNPSVVAGRAQNGVEIYDARQISLGIGDKIIWNKTDKSNDLKNGEKAEIIKISGTKLDLKFADKSKTIDTNELKNFDYAYADTAHIAQGMTYKKSFVLALSFRKNLINQKSFYVSISRAKDTTKVYTDDLDKLTKALYERAGDKTSSIESLNFEPKNNYISSLSKLCNDILTKGINVFSKKLSVDKIKSVTDRSLDAVAVNKLTHAKDKDSMKVTTPNYSKKEIIDAKEVDVLLRNNVGVIAQQILGKYNKKIGRNKGSLAVTISGQHAGTWKDFGTDEKGNLISLIQKQYGLSFREALEEAAKLVNYIPGEFRQELSKLDNGLTSKHDLTDQQKLSIKKAEKLVAESKEIQGTVAEKYLKEERGIDLDNWSNDLRYHDGVYSKINKAKYPALLVIARDKDHSVQSVQAIYLDEKTGKKANVDVQKQTFGTIKEALFLANNQQQNNKTAIICEGPEDALSILKSTNGKDVYACFGKSNFNNLNPEKLAKYDKIILALDNDGQNPSDIPNILNAAFKLNDDGKSVMLVQPEKVKVDYNDTLKLQGSKAVESIISKGKSFDDFQSSKNIKIDKENAKIMEKEI